MVPSLSTVFKIFPKLKNNIISLWYLLLYFFLLSYSVQKHQWWHFTSHSTALANEAWWDVFYFYFLSLATWLLSSMETGKHELIAWRMLSFLTCHHVTEAFFVFVLGRSVLGTSCTLSLSRFPLSIVWLFSPKTHNEMKSALQCY